MATGTTPRKTPAHGSLTDECAGVKGLTGNAVLDQANFAAKAVFLRFPPERPYGYPDPNTATPARLQIRYEGGDVTCEKGGISDARSNPVVTQPSVEVAVLVDFATDDGLFDEHVVGTLRAYRGGLSGNDATLEAVIPVASLSGSYKALAAADAEGPEHPVKLHGNFRSGDREASGGGVDHGSTFFGVYRFEK